MELKDVKYCLNRYVWYKGSRYVFTGCTIRKVAYKDDCYYQAEIMDQNKNAACIVKLSDIHRKEVEDDIQG